ncbi:MAG: ATP12 family chaperone protein [Sphingomonadaceae bacterium]
MKRFYRSVTVEEDTGRAGWRVLLDGRAIRTSGGADQIVPSQDVAEALAQEWESQGEEIDVSRFLFRDLTDYAIDIVAPDRKTAIHNLLDFAQTDTLCYRAPPEDALFERQQAEWEPLLRQLELSENLLFERISGVIHRPQPAETIAALKSRLEGMDNYTLAAMQLLVSLPASLVIGLIALDPDANIHDLWQIANLEELWQAELWGMDSEAAQRLRDREKKFTSAARYVALLR